MKEVLIDSTPDPKEEKNPVKSVLKHAVALVCVAVLVTACASSNGHAGQSANPTPEHSALAQPQTVELSQSSSTPEQLVSFETLSTTPPEVSYLAGFATAGLSTTGKVAVYIEESSDINEAMAGAFAQGIEEYNRLHGSSIQVLKLTRQATASPFSSGNPLSGLANDGIDMVMLLGVTNPQQNLETIHAQEQIRVIWVGEDAAARYDAYRGIVLTSLVRTPDALAAHAAESAQSASAQTPTPADPSTSAARRQLLAETTPTSLAPLRDFSGEVSDTLRTELDELATRIQNGTVEVNAPAAH